MAAAAKGAATGPALFVLVANASFSRRIALRKARLRRFDIVLAEIADTRFLRLPFRQSGFYDRSIAASSSPTTIDSFPLDATIVLAFSPIDWTEETIRIDVDSSLTVKSNRLDLMQNRVVSEYLHGSDRSPDAILVDRFSCSAAVGADSAELLPGVS